MSMTARETHAELPEPLSRPEESYRFIAPRRARAVLFGSLLAAIVLTALATSYAVRSQSTSWIVGAAVGAMIVVILWSTAKARVPQVVTIKRSVLTITRNGHTEQFDLVDPTVEILGRDGELALRCYDGRFAVVRARDVEWKKFTDVVMHYQNHADRKAEDRAARFSR